MSRRTLLEEARVKADVEQRLRGKKETIYSIAKTTGCSPTTIRRYRKALLTASEPVLSVVPPVQLSAQTAQPVENPYRVKQRVVFHEAPRTVEAILSAEVVVLYGVRGGASTTVHVRDLKPLTGE